MILGDRCTRACGFCQVDTRKPLAARRRRAAARRRSGRRARARARGRSRASRATTCPTVARRCSRRRCTRSARRSPETTVEVLIADCKGDAAALDTIFAAAPDVLNHNLETVARLQRAARPSAGYARSLAVLARAKAAGLVTKSGIILGMGETDDEVRGRDGRPARRSASRSSRIGQYLRPSADAPSGRRSGGRPTSSTALRRVRRSLGFAPRRSGPLVRSSYHARAGADRLVDRAGP